MGLLNILTVTARQAVDPQGAEVWQQLLVVWRLGGGGQ
jgi:hypothetical protein